MGLYIMRGMLPRGGLGGGRREKDRGEGGTSPLPSTGPGPRVCGTSLHPPAAAVTRHGIVRAVTSEVTRRLVKRAGPRRAREPRRLGSNAAARARPRPRGGDAERRAGPPGRSETAKPGKLGHLPSVRASTGWGKGCCGRRKLQQGLKNSKNKVCHSRILQGVDCREIER